MTTKETVNRNIGLTFDFLSQVVKDPSILNEISDGTTLEFVEKDFSRMQKRKSSKGKKRYIRVKSKFDIIGSV